ncbi:MAG: gluconate 2-dehydrogenase subunit 3 family protein [Saprospiraceae bacterium]
MNRREALKNTGLAVGYSLSAGTIAAVMNGCKAPTGTEWIPSSIDEDTIDIIAEVAETILPTTNTPGAKEMLVHRYVDEAISHAYGPKHKAYILAGINNITADLNDVAEGDFMHLTGDAKLDAVIKMEELADAFNAKLDAKKAAEKAKNIEINGPERAGAMVHTEPDEFRHYYSDLKGLIIAGYFTSEKIGTEVLAYDPIPGDYDPCMVMSPGQKAWTH